METRTQVGMQIGHPRTIIGFSETRIQDFCHSLERLNQRLVAMGLKNWSAGR